MCRGERRNKPNASVVIYVKSQNCWQDLKKRLQLCNCTVTTLYLGGAGSLQHYVCVCLKESSEEEWCLMEINAEQGLTIGRIKSLLPSVHVWDSFGAWEPMYCSHKGLVNASVKTVLTKTLGKEVMTCVMILFCVFSICLHIWGRTPIDKYIQVYYKTLNSKTAFFFCCNCVFLSCLVRPTPSSLAPSLSLSFRANAIQA